MFGYDDALDAFGVHGVGGIVGALLTGVFAIEQYGGHRRPDRGAIRTGPQSSLRHRDRDRLRRHRVAVLLKIIDMVIGLRVSDAIEQEGLDIALHGEVGAVTAHDRAQIRIANTVGVGDPAPPPPSRGLGSPEASHFLCDVHRPQSKQSALPVRHRVPPLRLLSKASARKKCRGCRGKDHPRPAPARIPARNCADWLGFSATKHIANPDDRRRRFVTSAGMSVAGTVWIEFV